MNPALIILLGFGIFYVIEVFHDFTLEQIRRKHREILMLWKQSDQRGVIDITEDLQQDQIWSDRWHRLDWIGHALVAVLCSYLLIQITGLWSSGALAAALGCLRILILNIGLNIKREKKGGELLYLGSSGFGGWFKGREIVFYSGVLLLFFGSMYLTLYGQF